MTKILILSDTHSGLSFMRHCIDRLKPQHIIHLGDHFADGEAMAQEYPHICFHQVPGNCDRYRTAPWQADILSYPIEGINFYMSHGHLHGVKSGLHRFLLDARKSKADIALYGHTHIADCHREEDGLYVLNPGSGGSWSGSVGLIEITDGKISSFRIMQQADLV